MAKADPFGFDKAAVEETPEIDISAFAPRTRAVDRPALEASREVARDSGFTRRPAHTAPDMAVGPGPQTTPASKVRKRRVNIAELLGIEDRYPDTDRVQVNMLAPVPIALRWRALVQARQAPAWEILEAAMEALEAQAHVPAKRASAA